MRKDKPVIKTGFCVAYDWQLLENSLPAVYHHSDIICLAVDKARRSWSGNKFKFDDAAFYELIKKIDIQNKVDIYEDDFSLANLNARENCNRHRTMIADRMGKGGWHIQVDCDEYFCDFKGFTEFLIKQNPYPTGFEKPFNVHVFLYDLFKKVDGGYLYANPKSKRPFAAPFATTKPVYERARHNGHFNKVSPFFVVHETWARTEEELSYKLSNWGHSAEEMKNEKVRESYINLWKAIDRFNYRCIRDFHFAVAHVWETLSFVEADNMGEFMKKFNPDFYLSELDLQLANSRIVGKGKQIISQFMARYK